MFVANRTGIRESRWPDVLDGDVILPLMSSGYEPGSARRCAPSCQRRRARPTRAGGRDANRGDRAYRRNRQACSRIAASPAEIAQASSPSPAASRHSSRARACSTTPSDVRPVGQSPSALEPSVLHASSTPRSAAAVAARPWSRSLRAMTGRSTAAPASTRSAPQRWPSPSPSSASDHLACATVTAHGGRPARVGLADSRG
jgi:hypothetical protein